MSSMQLKKELMILRKEKEDGERARSAPTTSKPEKKPSDDVLKKLAKRDKEVDSLKQVIADNETTCDVLQGEKLAMARRLEQNEQELQSLREEHAGALETAKKAAMDLRQTKLSYDELKRKYQKVTKELKDEKSTLATENAQLVQRQDELQAASTNTAQLKKQLAQARERLSSIVHEFEERQREKEKAHAATVESLEASWRVKLEESSAKRDVDITAQVQRAKEAIEATQASKVTRLAEELHLEKEENVDLLQTVKSLQDKLKVLTDVVREAELAKKEATADAAHAHELCAKAEEAADACESQARKYKGEWAALDEKVHLIDNALKLRGISVEFLLKKSGNNNHDDDGSSLVGPSAVSIKKDKAPSVRKLQKAAPERDDTPGKPRRK
ncbi:Aste57867_25349 [Aphanomyces stellatus]|uniref:Aste57867_25349 protein n=1 Tax=Aphanomyces stellatus TaxID=120398 RepID=A0A485LSV4_9STRA|nr:hypothetical protein As57867_025271 [Aphanomyces stellatus]VFU01974.1 Aste57867_25349 [Aphanomyces stellatus]